jgi:hypothetical protein
MIDFPELSLIMLCHDDNQIDWGNADENSPNAKQIIKDSRLAEAFKVEQFVVPPLQNGINNLSVYGLRFPGAQYCPRCGLIHQITRDMGRMVMEGVTFDQGMRAFNCIDCTNHQANIRSALVPMRFVIATEEGFLGDFPWDWFVHRRLPEQRKKNHKLYFKSRGGSAGLRDIIVESRSHNGNRLIASENLGDIFDQAIFTTPDAHGHYLNYVKGYLPKPWKGWHDNESYVTELINDIPSPEAIMNGEDLSDEAKRKFPRTMQRGAGNIIFPIIYSGILLPKTSFEQQCPPEVQKILDSTIESYKDNSPDTYQVYTNDQWRDLFLKNVEKNPNHKLLKLDYNIFSVKCFIKNYFGDNTEERYINKAVLLREQEFKAFTGPIMDDDTVWFNKAKVAGGAYNTLIDQDGLLDEVVLMEKLSALKVYKGFTRVRPLLGEELVFAEAADNLNATQRLEFDRIQDARKDPTHTRELPAVEVKGEGILLKFSNDRLNAWSNTYCDNRLDTINSNLQLVNRDFQQNHQLLTKRYLFLHTLSHILLKELAEDCGYSLSSLSEIIYCSSDDKIGTDDEMNGILIYTTTSDAEGSLGGLVEKGQPNYLSSIIKKGVDKARWCSSDPLCISADQGQGFMGLNLAACYSCVLLPETSCEKMNKYLDRAAVIGMLNNPDLGLFNQ